MKADKSLIVFGLDAERKPHAARFDVVDEAAVRKAASLMGFQLGRAKTKEAINLATKLTPGRIFQTGRGLVPFVKAETYEALLKLLEIEQLVPQPETPQDVAEISPPADLWAAVKIGSVILVQDPTPEPSWWECVVTAVSKDGRTLTVKWRDTPTLKPFTVKRAAVAMLPIRG